MFTIVAVFAIFFCAKTQAACSYNKAVGLDVNDKNDDIPDSAFTSSTKYAYGYRAARGRLNTIYEGTSSKKGGWMAEQSDSDPWIEVDLQERYTVKKIITQGRQCGNNWVTDYQVQYKTSGNNFYDVTDPENDLTMTFSGNSDRNTKVTNELPAAITARYIRIRPTDWYGSSASLRFDVVGCKVDTDP